VGVAEMSRKDFAEGFVTNFIFGLVTFPAYTLEMLQEVADHEEEFRSELEGEDVPDGVKGKSFSEISLRQVRK